LHCCNLLRVGICIDHVRTKCEWSSLFKPFRYMSAVEYSPIMPYFCDTNGSSE
jgi:hypothetical protein